MKEEWPEWITGVPCLGDSGAPEMQNLESGTETQIQKPRPKPKKSQIQPRQSDPRVSTQFAPNEDADRQDDDTEENAHRAGIRDIEIPGRRLEKEKTDEIEDHIEDESDDLAHAGQRRAANAVGRLQNTTAFPAIKQERQRLSRATGHV